MEKINGLYGDPLLERQTPGFRFLMNGLDFYLDLNSSPLIQAQEPA